MTYPVKQNKTIHRDWSPFSKQLVAAGYVNPRQMQEALLESRQSGKSLVSVLQGMTGKMIPSALLAELKKQQFFELKLLHGVQSVDLTLDSLPMAPIHGLIDTLIPHQICQDYELLPLSKTETPPLSVMVAMVNPGDLRAQEQIVRQLEKFGNPAVIRRVVTKEGFQRVLNDYLRRFQSQKPPRVTEKLVVDIYSDLANLDDLPFSLPEEDGELMTTGTDGNDAPIINLVSNILIQALQEEASDIHVEPQEESLRIRFRKDGVLQQAFDPFPKQIIPAVITRFKILANLDIAERRHPQDGRIRQKYQGKKVDFRVNTLPSRFGEKVCLRILRTESTQLGLDQLITDFHTLGKVRQMARHPYGLILVSGPTGSGKSTTLYSILAEHNHPGVNISTVEDPIEYFLPGITQVQVIREKQMDFASILRAFMRQDPDIILVGETRDLETAKTAIEASLTGHLVLTTIHGNDAASSITRLDEMGVEPFLLSSSLIGVCAQRLIRRVCPECRIPYQPTSQELGRFGLSLSRDGSVVFYRAKSLSNDEIQLAHGDGGLCPHCLGTGYKGRWGVYEVMPITERIQSAITQRATGDRMKEIAVEEGMITLLTYSLNLVKEGLTTLEEVERVTFADSGLEMELKAKRLNSYTCQVCQADLRQEWYDCPFCTTPRALVVS
ncbi:MAG: type II/IV secretion system protein [Cyanobacteria bacterium WB6_1B_304]|nr:type II/IV secretion system protein [Cyanobacteria bacterium WB6_1B_304]